MTLEKRGKGSHNINFVPNKLAHLNPDELAESVEKFLASNEHLPESRFSKSAIAKAMEESHHPIKH